METRASYLLVGGFVMIVIVAMVGFILWIAKEQIDKKPATYQTYFTTTVTGLQVGSVVRYRGILVGEVTNIRISLNNAQEVEVTFEVKRDTPISRFSTAVLETQGITGVAFIQIKHDQKAFIAWRAIVTNKAIRPGLPVVDVSRGAKYPTLESDSSGFDKILSDLPKMLASIRELADAAKKLFDQDNIESIKITLANLAKLSKDVSKSGEKIDRLVANLEKAAVQIPPAIVEARTGIRNFSAMSANLDKMIKENRRPLRDFAATGLYELSQFITEARELVRNLNRVSKRIEDDPSRFLFGSGQKGYTPK
ncbi:MAG: MlaD family protein [Alphaproteobacteria bacterium]